MTPPPDQPTLQTARLVLRPFRPEDAPEVRRLAGDRRVADTTLSVPHPYPDGAAEGWISTHAARWAEGTEAVFAVTDRRTGALLGAAGLVLDPAQQRAELGYWIGPDYWNRGYATEAARAMIRFGIRGLGLHRIVARHFTRNPASGAVLRKAGMTREGRQREHFRRWDRWEDTDVYGILDRELADDPS